MLVWVLQNDAEVLRTEHHGKHPVQNKNFVERLAKPQKQSSLGKDNNSHPPWGLPGTKKPNEAVSYKWKLA